MKRLAMLAALLGLYAASTPAVTVISARPAIVSRPVVSAPRPAAAAPRPAATTTHTTETAPASSPTRFFPMWMYPSSSRSCTDEDRRKANREDCK